MSARALATVAAASLLAVLSAGAAGATDGVVQINQARALAGDVTPTDDSGFPVDIWQAGHYRLTSNLDVGSADGAENLDAIRVHVPGVEIDLNGFSLVGPTSCTGSPVTSCSPAGSGRGVNADDAAFTRVVNGFVRGFADWGIYGDVATVIEDVGLFSNGSGGAYVSYGGRIERSTAVSNGGPGFHAFDYWARIARCRALDNLASGFYLRGGEIRDSEAVHNGIAGITQSEGLAERNISRGNVVYSYDGSGGAYTQNVFSVPPLAGSGTALGPNLCTGALCP